MRPEIQYRVASAVDVPAMARSRGQDAFARSADERMAAYLQGKHHPQRALPPRVAWVATINADVIGYVAGHLTRRFDCEGGLQYMYVAPAYRRNGVGRELVKRLAKWFGEHSVGRICVNVDDESPVARLFYQHLGARELQPHWMVWSDITSVGRVADQP